MLYNSILVYSFIYTIYYITLSYIYYTLYSIYTDDALRFEGIDTNVKKELKTCWTIKNTDLSCNQEGLLHRLENILRELEICKKALSDFLDGRRRQFPRYYFTSEADLLGRYMYIYSIYNIMLMYDMYTNDI